MEKDKASSYKDTLNLPRTDFPMKADLPKREPLILKKWEEANIYETVLKSRERSGKRFVLHDGPPYANGHIHMGHVLNKILKDICVKYHTMKGFYSPYVPGWDCHGLPVEHQLFKELGISKSQITQSEFRSKAHDYAMKFVAVQAEEFKRLGVFGDWKDPYLTLSREYESEILSALADLCERGFVYKGLKPVNWCRTCETALAEAEVEYEDKSSPSVYVKFRAVDRPAGEKTFFVIWTTTPWTLLSNVAVALHPDLSYSAVEVGGEKWVMLSELVDRLMSKFGLASFRVAERFSGRDAVKRFKKVRHPFIERDSVLVLAGYVTKEEGTGCVHIAPGHGEADYKTAREYDLPVLMPVDEKGFFTKDAGSFAGMDIFKANGGIVDRIRENGSLIFSDQITHSYPHCWRCKEPIIFRATEQWFMKIDHRSLRKNMLKVIKSGVEWIPPMGEERIGSMVETRPDWCLSRQRYWGVPIPAFACRSCGRSVTTPAIIRKAAVLTFREGSNAWLEKGEDELLPPGMKCPACSSREFRKEKDILDVWFDSGVSHMAVLKKRKELYFPADLYLEGSDQHRGWFQTALVTAMALFGHPPFKKVLTHGFVVDGEGKKMSKSLGNVISPEDVMREYGADILRLWVASSDYDGDIKLSGEILERLSDGYRKIRNTFKYLLSNLYDFDEKDDIVDRNKLSEIDRWMLSRLARLLADARRYYDSWAFHKVYRSVYDFCVYEVSAFYLDIIKDILYVEGASSAVRRSAQTAIWHLVNLLARVMAPLIPFTCEEAWSHMKGAGRKEESVHMARFVEEREISSWVDRRLDEKWKKILSMRDVVMRLLERKREEGAIGSSLEAGVRFWSKNKRMLSFLKENRALFPMVFRVSCAEVTECAGETAKDDAGREFAIEIIRAPGAKCARCWNWSETTGSAPGLPDLCERCVGVLASRGA